MRFCIVGNNDGPLYLLKGLQGSAYSPELVGLQNRVPASLRAAYKSFVNHSGYIEGFGESELLDALQSREIDLLINCFCNFRFTRLLDQTFEVLNVHLSPLPAYRGRHPLPWALINGLHQFGITIHKMTEKYDAGPIYWKKNVELTKGMSVQQLRTELLTELQDDFIVFLEKYEAGKINPYPNNDNEASYMPRRYPKDSKLSEWGNSETIYRKVMALRSEANPAYLMVNRKKIICLEARMSDNHIDRPQRPYINKIKEPWISVICRDGRSVWLHADPEMLKYLSLNQTIA